MTTPLQPGVFVDVTQSPLAQSVTNIPGEGQAAFAAAYNMGPVNPVQVTSWSQFVRLFGSFQQSSGSLLHQSVYQFFANGGSSCFCVRIPNDDASPASLVVLDNGNATPDDTPAEPAQVMTVTASTYGAWGNEVYIGIAAVNQPGSGAAGSGRFNLQVYLGGTAQSNLVETFNSVSVNPNDTRNVVTVINSPYAGSQYVTVSVDLDSVGGVYVQGTTDPAPLPPTPLTGGDDGDTAPADLGAAVTGVLDQLQDQILYVNLPGVNEQATISSLLSWADSRGDVMVIIDGNQQGTSSNSSSVASYYSTQLAATFPADANAVIYAPWLLVLDPTSAVPGATRYVPPGGAVLGVWQRGLAQYGVQQAPAGVWATLNAQGLEANFTSADLASLNTANVNAIKVVPNTGICIFGARTLDVGLPSRYVNVQRTLIQLAHDMENLLAFATFEPNNTTLWASITNVLTSYLTTQMQDGVLAGTTPATSFSVVCDSTINTPNTVQSGVVNVQVGVAVSSPAEFIIINLQQLSATASSSS